MKTRNPIRFTVTNFVTAKGRRRKSEYKKLTFSDFFNDLENRGPLKPNSVFEKWTKKIHKDMLKKKTWIKEGEGVNLTFVQEYISRLQREFWKENMVFVKKTDIRYFIYSYHTPDVKYLKTFKNIYKKIRAYGLRSKTFCILKAYITVSVSYRRLVINTHVTRYEFGIEYVEDWRQTYLAEHHNHKAEFLYCTPFGMTDMFVGAYY